MTQKLTATASERQSIPTDGDWRLTALAASHSIGLFDWNIRADIVRADPYLAEFFGVAPGEAEEGLPLERWIAAIDEADRPRVSAAIQEAVRTGEPYHEEYTLCPANRTPIRVVARGRCLHDECGPWRFPGTVADVTDRWRAQRAEAEANRHFQTLLDALPQMVFLSSPTGENEYYNARCYEVSGLRPGELTSARWRQLIHPSEREQVLSGWGHALSIGEPWEMQYRALDREGRYRWLLVRAEPLRDREGRIERWLGTATDVSDLKHVEADRERLADELNHRVRNNMAIVQALALRTFPCADADSRQAFASRIQALSRVHDVLSERSWRRTRLRDVIDAALVGCDAASRIDAFGPPITIEPKQAVAVGLAVHELWLHAVANGVPEDGEGAVRVRWTVEEARCDDEGPAMHLTWTETGGRPVDEAPSGGLGLSLVEGSLATEFGGVASAERNADGLVFTLTAPLPQAGAKAVT